MSQRKKSGAIWANRQEPQKGKLRRTERQVHVRPLLLIACEGEETEPNYLIAYFRELVDRKVISSRSYVIAPHGHTDPLGVLKDLMGFKQDGLKTEDFERKWIFIDRDEARTNENSGHTVENFKSAIADARRAKVKVAWSNPCFELWFLLHFELRSTFVDRADLPNLLTKRLGFDYAKNNTLLYVSLRDKIQDALRNAEKLAGLNTAEPCDANPMTTVHEFFMENNAATLTS